MSATYDLRGCPFSNAYIKASMCGLFDSDDGPSQEPLTDLDLVSRTASTYRYFPIFTWERPSVEPRGVCRNVNIPL